jgi:hypothetical protein
VGIISGMLDGLDPLHCLERGNAIGALAVTVRGDMDGLPTRDILSSFLQAARRSGSASFMNGKLLPLASPEGNSVATQE